MNSYTIEPTESAKRPGWVVRTTHDNGVVEISIVYATKALAQAAADGWTHLDDDWADV